MCSRILLMCLRCHGPLLLQIPLQEFVATLAPDAEELQEPLASIKQYHMIVLPLLFMMVLFQLQGHTLYIRADAVVDAKKVE